MNVNTTNTYSTSSATNKGMSGLISGMDTESMVEQMLAGTQGKIDKQEQEKQKIIWQQLKYREIIDKLNNFQDTFFGSTSSTNLGSVDFFNAMSVMSSSKAFSAIASPEAAMGNMSIRVGQLATASSLKSGQTVSGRLSGTQNMDLSALKRQVVFNIGGQEVNVELAAPDSGKTDEQNLDAMIEKINEQLAGKGVSASKGEKGDLVLTGNFSISAKSSALGMNMLGVTAGQKSTESISTTANPDAAVSFKVDLNGISRTITLDGLDENSSMNDVLQKMQKEIDSTFGKGWITVGQQGGKFSLTTGGKGNVATISGDADNLSLLGVQSGQSNKISRGQMLKDTQFSTALRGDKFEFSINGVDFSFDGESTINDVIKTVNSSKAGVRLTYSDLEDKFTIESTETGAGRSIDLKQTSGNLLNAMFGNVEGMRSGSSASSRQLVKVSAQGASGLDGYADSFEGGTFSFKVDGKAYSISIPDGTSRSDAVTLINEGLASRFGYGADGKQVIEMTGSKGSGYKMEVRNGAKISFDDVIPAGTADADKASKLSEAAKSSLHVAFGFNGVDNVVKEDEIATLKLSDIGITGANAGKTIQEYMNEVAAGKTGSQAMTASFEDGRIVLTASGEGYAGRSASVFPELNDLFGGDVQLNMSPSGDTVKVVEGQNAVAEINGVVVERSSNTFTTAGLTITLNEATSAMPKLTATGNADEYTDESGTIYKLVNGQIQDADGKVMDAYKGMTGLQVVNGYLVNADGDKVIGGSTESINTSRNTDQIVEGLKSFVEKYNELIGELNDLVHADATYRDYPPLTSAQKKEMTEREIELWEEKAQEGLYRNDSDISSFLQNMRTALYSKPEGSEYALYDIGIETSSEWRDYGKLNFDESKVRAMVESNPQAVQELFTNATSGLSTLMVNELKRTANTSSASAGTLVEKAGVQGKATAITNQMTQRLISINERIEELKKKYETEKTRYWNQFNSMETALSNMNTQSSWLAMQFSY